MYLSYLKSLPKDGPANISATVAAAALSLNEVQVRKDFAAVGEGGKPKIGYITEELIADIENCLGRSKSINAVLVGAGNLGRALLCCESFSQYGLTIAAAFDCSENINTTFHPKCTAPDCTAWGECLKMLRMYVS